MRKLTIAHDMDDVVCDLQTPWFKWINETYDDNITTEKVKSWSVHLYTKAKKECYKFLDIPGVFLNLEPKQDAIKVMNKMNQDGHKIIFCTSNPTEASKEEKIEWLKHHVKFFNPDTDIIFSHDKPTDLRKHTQADVLFDDRLRWLVEFDKISIGMAYPYNQSFTGFRVTNWNDYYTLINQISNLKK